MKLDYARNANYWDKASKGNVENLTVVPIKEDATRVAALLGGDVDMIYPVAPNDLERVKNGKDSQLVTLSGTRAIIIELNQNTNPALKDKRVRQPSTTPSTRWALSRRSTRASVPLLAS